MYKKVRVRTLMVVILVLAIGLAVVTPYVQSARRLASACYILGEVVAPGRMETLGRQLTVWGAIKAAGGLRLSKEPVNIRLIRPASVDVPEQVLSIDMSDPSTDYAIKPGDRLIVAKSKGP
jgi:protein involved in polysaccharide export with SLBB domain